MSSLKEEELKKPEPDSPKAAKEMPVADNELPTNRGIEVQSLLKRDSFVSSLKDD